MGDQAHERISAEQLPLSLRGLFEQRGYRRYRMSNFETYDFYRENKNFLESEGIITFTDTSGRLLALKPDVTMSIVKHTKLDTVSSRLYYEENVFRIDPQSGEYREISQVGLEYIGGQPGYGEAEVVELAARSLRLMGEETVLDIGHMGFVAGLFESIGLSQSARADAWEALRGKNGQALYEAAVRDGCAQDDARKLASLASLAGPFPEAIEKAEKLCGTDDMHRIVRELRSLYSVQEVVRTAEALRLDFSALGDMDYYNGIVFQGYVKGAPRAVLTGGRYDNLLRRFGKPQPALGFAICLSEWERACTENDAYDVDTLLLYDSVYEPFDVAFMTQFLLREGRESVRAEQSKPKGIRARSIIHLESVERLSFKGGDGSC